MILLVSGATLDLHRADPDRVGVLFVPHAREAAATAQALTTGRAWAGDNGAFSGFDAVAFVAMLAKLRGMPGCRFVVAPDVVGDAAATLELFARWAPAIRACGFPVALAAQDGLTVATTPWRELDALFIGGSTAWKLSRHADALLEHAHRLGKWRHVGRVNSRRRMRHFIGLCESIDGSGFSTWGQRISLFERWVEHLHQTPQLPIRGGAVDAVEGQN